MSRSLSILLLILVSATSGFAQTEGLATIRTRFFHDPDNGIRHLVHALQEADNDFFSLPYLARERRFNEMVRICDPEENEAGGNQQIREFVCPVVEDIGARLREFSQGRRIKYLIDISNESCLFPLNEKIHITREFVDEYNRLNP